MESIVADIRDATAGERAALGELHRRSSYIWEEDRPHFEAHPDVFGVDPDAIAQGRVRVAIDARGALLGFATVADGGTRTWELEDLFVEPRAMRLGVGRALVQDAAARARAEGIELMTVVAHPRTFPFYESVGFVAGEPVQTRFGPAVRLRRTLRSVAMADVTVAEEEYLQTLYWLYEARLPMTGANVARAMQLSAPTVHEMIGRLERDGHITRASDKAISFTDSGREHAEAIVRRHRLIERFLTDVLGIPWDEVHEEAERLEHAMSPVLEERMLAAIGDAKTCPHGHPINAGSRIEGAPLADVAEGASLTVLRFENEAEDLLHELKASGMEPGMTGTLATSGADEVTIRTEGGDSVSVTRSVAETVSVLADPAPPPRVTLPEQLVLARDRYGR